MGKFDTHHGLFKKSCVETVEIVPFGANLMLIFLGFAISLKRRKKVKDSDDQLGVLQRREEIP